MRAPFDIRRGTGGLVAALGIAVPVLTACFPLGTTHADDLRSAAAALVPPGSRVVEQSDGDCVEFEPSPSCRLIYFVAPRGETSSLAREVQTRAATGGWAVTRKDVYEGGTELRLNRSGLRAYISLAAGNRALSCRRRPSKECASLVNVSID